MFQWFGIFSHPTWCQSSKCTILLMTMIHVIMTRKLTRACLYDISAGTEKILYPLAAACCSAVNKIRRTQPSHSVSIFWIEVPENPDVNVIITLRSSVTTDTSSIVTINKHLIESRYLVTKIFPSLSLLLTIFPLNVAVSLFVHTWSVFNRGS